MATREPRRRWTLAAPAMYSIVALAGGCAPHAARPAVSSGHLEQAAPKAVAPRPSPVNEASLTRAQESAKAKLSAEPGPHWDVPIWHHMLLMTGMRVVESVIWPDPFAETRAAVIAERYEAAFTSPPKWDVGARPFEWDGDAWYINAVGHSAFGSELYLAARRCGFGPLGASGFAAAGSTAWEYGFEANGVRPSGVDLWFTPFSGVILGEVRHWLLDLAADIPNPVARGMAQGAVDPFGSLMRSLGAEC